MSYSHNGIEVFVMQNNINQQELKSLLPQNSSEYEATLINVRRKDGYYDEQIAEFLEAI